LALINYHKAIFLDDKFYSVYINRGEQYLELNEFSKSLLDLAQAVRIKPGHNATYPFQAQASTVLGLERQTEAAFMRAVALGYNPDLLVSQFLETIQPASPPKAPSATPLEQGVS